MANPPIWAMTVVDLDLDPYALLTGVDWDFVDDKNWFAWQWCYCLLCRGCGYDKDIGIHGSYSPFGGCA